ncbi:MAG: protein-glutamate O-methyltransferase CheR [Planctomycetota bacterium]
MPPKTSGLEFVRTLVRDRAGIVLESNKDYLIESRLSAVARKCGHSSLDDFLDAIQGKRDPEVLATVVDAMTTNETSFFREMHVFEGLRKTVLPECIEFNKSRRQLNFWCGAASSGQEPYTIAMALQDWFPELATWKIQFTATDISQEMLARCQEGVYSQLEVNRGLPVPMLLKHFQKQGADWRVKDHLRRYVTFRELNLIGKWPPFPTLDVVFLRNVLIYFDVDTKKKILANIRTFLRPQGFLFLGSAETTLNLDNDFERVKFDRGCCYRHVPRKAT